MGVRPAKRFTSASTLWILLCVIFVLYMLTPRSTGIRPSAWIENYQSRQQTPMDASGDDSRADPTIHPIKALHEGSVKAFEAMVERQSKTLKEAVTEYKRRYRRNPPPGFDKWFQYAKERDSLIIDDFDMIDESMEPFWKLEPHLIKKMYERAADGPELWTFSIHNGHPIASEENWMGERIGSTLGDATSDIPNLDLLMNPLDEPRVLLSKISETDRIRWTDESQQSSWDSVVGPCKYRDVTSRNAPKTLHVNTHGLPFVTNRATAMDVCANPSFQHNHGFFIAPYSLITTRSPVPILSQAAPSTFSDILYPSMYYWDRKIENLEEVDPDWSEKTNRLYWAGSTTGGYNRVRHKSEPAWRSHRHRFVELTKQLVPERAYKFLQQTGSSAKSASASATGPHRKSKGEGAWTRYESEEILSKLYDTKFTRMVQCEEEACRADDEYYKIGHAEDNRLAFKNRFLMDMDGNSFSGRFYNFLASKACPLKQSVFREWHDERLYPWVHYIPISTSLTELPETMRYLALTEEGGEIARSVAERGTVGHDAMLRREDAAIYLYRLFLEFARVTTEGRDERRIEVKTAEEVEMRVKSALATTKDTMRSKNSSRKGSRPGGKGGARSRIEKAEADE